MVLATNFVILVFVLEFLCLVTNTGAGHHGGHHAGHHSNHGHHSGHDAGHCGRRGNGRVGGGVGKNSRYYGHGGVGRRLDQGHVSGKGPREQAPSMHRSGGKKSLNPVGYLSPDSQHQPRVSAHSKKKGHADIVRSQMTSRDVNSVTLPSAATKFT